MCARLRSPFIFESQFMEIARTVFAAHQFSTATHRNRLLKQNPQIIDSIRIYLLFKGSIPNSKLKIYNSLRLTEMEFK